MFNHWFIDENLMKQIIVTYCLFNGILAQSMEPNPFERIIRDNITQPSNAIKLLEDFSTEELRNYRAHGHNNLMHIAIEELNRYKYAQNYEQLQNDCKPLIRYLAKSGIDVNEANDNHDTPCLLAYKYDVNDDFVENFLEPELRAKPSYFSLQPEIRALKKMVTDLCCCSCKRKSKQQ
jgi:hypothetical protein